MPADALPLESYITREYAAVEVAVPLNRCSDSPRMSEESPVRTLHTGQWTSRP